MNKIMFGIVNEETLASKPVRKFKVVGVSQNRNSFGLAGVVVMAKSGEAWEIGANHVSTPKVGDMLNIPLDIKTNSPIWANYEIPRRLINAPPAVVKEVWK